jgi:phosphopantothenoylcysteine decarboxylase/phosphopantothenate--cysteine ligase
MNVKGKSIVLGVTGGIAAYKAVALCSYLVKAGAVVDVILTDAAREFVAPLTFQALTHRPVVTEMFRLLDGSGELGRTRADIGHVSLAKRADLLIIAPATANTITKLAVGLADNMLTTTALATRAPILLAPAMESHMWTNPLTQDNVARLRQLRDVSLVGPGEGRLASGASGVGRMAEPEEILDAASWVLGRRGPLTGRRIVVTAGGTREPLDPIRFLGNRSSGLMGYALARAARDRGAQVTLISTSGQAAPFGAKLAPVETAAEMLDAVLGAMAGADVLLMAAAVADYRPATTAAHKIKKGEKSLKVDLIRTPDILAQVAKVRRTGQVIVGFAAETENLVDNALDKLQRKGLDLIVANDARQAMGAATNQVTLITADGHVEALPLLSKDEVAAQILDRIEAVLIETVE